MSIYCENCGCKNDDENLFCENCGSKLAKDQDFQQTVDTKEKKRSNPKTKTISIVAVVLVAVALATFFVIKTTNDARNEEYNAKIAEAEDYRNDGKIKKAREAYLEAIDIDDKKEDAYYPLSDIYISERKYDKADSILQDGIDKTGSSKLKSQKEITEQYVILNNYFVSTSKGNIATTNESFINRTHHGGALSVIMDDYNADGNPEMLVVNYVDSTDNCVDIKMYQAINDEAKEIGSMQYYMSNGMYLASKAAVFIKEVGSKKYLCIKAHNVPNTEEYESTFSIYDLSAGINECENLQYYSGYGVANFYDNYNNVASYDEHDDPLYFDYMDGIVDYSELKKNRNKVEQTGLSAMDKRLKLYNFSVSSIKDDVFPKYVSKDKTQTGICYIVQGEFDGNGNVRLGNPDLVYLEDYTKAKQLIQVAV